MARRRLGVVLPVPAPVAQEVDGLRRACGDGMLERVMPHLTLVPPVNVRESDLGAALAVVRAAATGIGHPIVLDIGPAATFAPASPTVYLAVDGSDDALADLTRLRDVVFTGPLARVVTWPFVPHVTVADEVAVERIPAMIDALSGYGTPVKFDRVLVLEEGPDRVWAAIAEARLGPARVVGRGGLPLEIAVSELVDAEASALLPADQTVEDDVAPPADAVPLVVVARLAGEVVGALRAWTAGGGGAVEHVAVALAAGHLDVARHLVETARSVAAERACSLP